jgi:flagellin
MGLRIQNNVEAFNAHRTLTATASDASKSMEKLSSGYRINRASDDAAGLSISEKMRGQIGGLAQAQRNAQDGISLVQTAEGSLSEVHAMLQRVRDLKVQHSNGTLSTDDQSAIESEIGQIGQEIKSIVDNT